MTTEKRDYSKLRPFDLEAARDRGELLTSPNDLCGGNPIWKYAAGPDSEGKIIAIVLDDGHFANPARTSAFRMAPLAWVRASADDDTLLPVYKGDTVWNLNGDKSAILVSYFEDNKLCGIDPAEKCPSWSFTDQLTFTPPKVKREGWVNIYSGFNANYVATTSHAWPTKDAADFASGSDRIACIRIEWEDPAGQEGGAQ